MPSETEQHLETLPMSSSRWLHDLLLLLILAALVGILIWKRREVQQVLISAYHAVRRWILARLGRTQKHFRKQTVPIVTMWRIYCIRNKPGRQENHRFPAGSGSSAIGSIAG